MIWSLGSMDSALQGSIRSLGAALQHATPTVEIRLTTVTN